MEGRQRRLFTDDYKRQAVDLAASSGRSIGSVAKELGLRDSVSRRPDAGDAAVGGPRGGDRPFAARQRAAAHGARHFKKLSSTVARLCGLETASIMQHVRKPDVISLHRGLLQSNASPLGHRISQPDRDGAKSSLTLSIFSGEDQTFPGSFGMSQRRHNRIPCNAAKSR